MQGMSYLGTTQSVVTPDMSMIHINGRILASSSKVMTAIVVIADTYLRRVWFSIIIYLFSLQYYLENLIMDLCHTIIRGILT